MGISHNCCFFPRQRLCLNGSTGQEVIISSGLETVEALAFDPLSQLLYWVDAGLKKIEVCVSPVLTQQVGLQPGGTDGAGGQVLLGNSQAAEDGPELRAGRKGLVSERSSRPRRAPLNTGTFPAGFMQEPERFCSVEETE